ncbi:MAG: hypothetical protein Q4A28_07580 [Brachymonas sp.]|nr:hypothetical protein [Brachymonas sp.]
MNYCTFANALPPDTADPNKHYHDHVYGFALADNNALFGRLLLEINQAGPRTCSKSPHGRLQMEAGGLLRCKSCP